ncbi:hypothetical protein FQA39_LY10405 [Lamprigera yunnana]|nr:hypothetical protein FQA39_LY10405 [Lamprigera yunnana]
MINFNVKVIFYSVFCTFLFSKISSYDIEYIQERYRLSIEHHLEFGSQARDYDDVYKVLQFPQAFRRPNTNKSVQSFLLCATCRTTISVFMFAIRNSTISDDAIRNTVVFLCKILKIQTKDVCEQSIDLNLDIILFIITEREDLTAARFCSIAFQSDGCTDDEHIDWSIPIPPKTNFSQKTVKQYDTENLNIIQLSDVHYSPEYEIGSNADCKEPVCCLNGTKPTSAEKSAGRWSDYRSCDISWEVLVNSLNHIRSQHKSIDYIYFTGDIVDHKSWATSREYNTKVIAEFLNLIQDTFPSNQFFPILGNHEAHPSNLFPPHNVSEIHYPWIYEFIERKWSRWLPSDTSNTILKGGYYTVLVKPGFRVIALNSNVCFTINWWLLYDDVDPFDQLKWLVQVLVDAEKNNERVHILSHIPHADEGCLQNWAKEYSKIVVRFSDTIAAQFYGHTHLKENNLFYEGNTLDKPVNIGFNGGSLTPYTYLNPNYALYYVNGETLSVDDYDIWIYDVSEANAIPETPPNWFKLYSFKDAYAVEKLNPESLNNLIMNMTKNCKLATQYFRFKSRNVSASLTGECDEECHYNNLCYMVRPYYGNLRQCNLINKEMSLSNCFRN